MPHDKILGPGTFTKRVGPIADAAGMTLAQYVLTTIEQQGSVSAAAQMLECNPGTLRHVLKRAGFRITTRYTSSVIPK